ncbi:MAG: hypothetical protein ACI97X_001207 [Oceanospirillaceae bacterium]|jgi:hypothetical protein
MTDVVQEVGVNELVRCLDRYEAKTVREELANAGKRFNSTLLLFDLIRSDRSGDVAENKKKAEGQGITQYYRTAARLHTLVEDHLKQVLLNSDSVDAKLWHVQSQVSVYWKKGFKEYALAQVRAGIEKLVLEDHPEHVLALLVEEQRMIRSANFDRREERHANYRSERNAALKIIENREAINDLSEEAYLLRKKYHSATHPEIESKVQKILTDPLLQNEISALSFTARIRWHVALGFCYSMLQNCERTIYHLKSVVQIWQNRPDQQILKPRTYQQAIINYLSECVKYEVDEDIEKYYCEAESIPIKDKTEAAAGFYFLSSFWLFYLMNNRPMDAGKEFAKTVEEGLTRHKGYLSDSALTVIQFNLADLMYLSDNLKESIRLFQVVAHKKTTVRKDLIGTAKMMVMLLEFDRENSVYLESLNKEARRYFKTNPEVDNLNAIVYEFIGKMLSIVKSEEKGVIDMLELRFKELVKDKGEVLGLEEVQIWLEGRRSGKTYGKVWMDKLAEKSS